MIIYVSYSIFEQWHQKHYFPHFFDSNNDEPIIGDEHFIFEKYPLPHDLGFIV
jgi:hypothetical protein